MSEREVRCSDLQQIPGALQTQETLRSTELNDLPSWIRSAKAISKRLKHNFKFNEYLVIIFFFFTRATALLASLSYTMIS